MREFVLPRLRMAIEDLDLLTLRDLQRTWSDDLADGSVSKDLMAATAAEINDCCDKADGAAWDASASILDDLERRWWLGVEGSPS